MHAAPAKFNRYLAPRRDAAYIICFIGSLRNQPKQLRKASACLVPIKRNYVIGGSRRFNHRSDGRVPRLTANAHRSARAGGIFRRERARRPALSVPGNAQRTGKLRRKHKQRKT
jgi:hypothetical protein